MKHRFIPLLLGIVLWGASCVPPIMDGRQNHPNHQDHLMELFM
ncbi:hypothetical protein [Chitinophaga sp. LS1]|nr:hypothetical protein [Chitinophaga sp. LS1]WPV66492.1 hypothetical protein QQL36_32365 [Chitinophaga sp. LS1]